MFFHLIVPLKMLSDNSLLIISNSSGLLITCLGDRVAGLLV